jgi:hypothetical protein
MTHLATAIIIFVLIILIIWYLNNQQEGFATRKEKAVMIKDWFEKNNKCPKYVNYVKDLDKQSNIVEYNDVMRLKEEQRLTVESVESVI